MTMQPYNEPPVYQHTDSWVPVVAAVGDLASKIAGTEFVGKGFRGKPASTAAAILTGRELGLGPMASLRGLQVIDGSVSMTAQMMAGKILAAGHRVEWIENTDKAAEVRITRGDGLGEATARFTITDAQRAGLAGKTNWQRYPRAMCRARALSECAGMIASDVILGLDAVDPVDNPTPQPVDNRVLRVTPAPELADLPYDNTAKHLSNVEEKPQENTQNLTQNLSENVTENVTEPTPETEPITPAQMRKIGAQIGEYERLDGTRMNRDERRTFIQHMAGLDKLATAKDLTKEQASVVIETLDLAIQDRMDQPIPVTESDEEGSP